MSSSTDKPTPAPEDSPRPARPTAADYEAIPFSQDGRHAITGTRPSRSSGE